MEAGGSGSGGSRKLGSGKKGKNEHLNDRRLEMMRYVFGAAASASKKKDVKTDDGDQDKKQKGIKMETEKFDKETVKQWCEARIMDSEQRKRNEKHIRLVEPALKLNNCASFYVNSKNTLPGTILQLRIIPQHPNQQEFEKPLFELADLFEQYGKMEKDMIKAYHFEFPTEPLLKLNDAREGNYAVIRTWTDEVDADFSQAAEPVYERIKFLTESPPLDGFSQWTVELVDSSNIMSVDLEDSNIFYLDREFAVLPPRVCDIEMEGLSHYKDAMLQRFFRRDSKEYAFGGLLTAEVQKSGKVIVWNERFPRDKFPYGINGYIIELAWEGIESKPTLPPQGYSREDAYVVYASAEGGVNMQFHTPTSAHYTDVINSIDEERLDSLRGSVERPREGEVYMARHEHTSNNYYRAMLDHRSPVAPSRLDIITPDSEIPIIFMDYGDKVTVKVKELVRAKDAHYMLTRFPKQYAESRMENIWNLDGDDYLSLFHAEDDTCTVHVVCDPKPGAVPEVVLKRTLKGEVQYINDVVANAKFGDSDKPIAEAVLPIGHSSSEFEDLGRPAANLGFKALRYLVATTETPRIQAGDELDVMLIYDRKIPGNRFFMVPESLKSRRVEFEVSMEKLGEAIDKLVKDGKGLAMIDYREVMTPTGVLCNSKRLESIVRGVIVGEHGGKRRERREDEDETAFLGNTQWDVYLTDYGIVETFKLKSLMKIKPDMLELPAFGIRAWNKKLISGEKIEKYFKAVRARELGNFSENSVEYALKGPFVSREKDQYNEGNSICKKIKIVSVSSGKYGEVAEVEWPTDADMEEMDGEVKPSCEGVGTEKLDADKDKNSMEAEKLGKTLEELMIKWEQIKLSTSMEGLSGAT